MKSKQAQKTPSGAAVALPCACATLRRASRAVTQLYDNHLRQHGLRVTQFTILQALEALGEATQGQLGQVLALDSTSLSRMLALMQRQGWIQSLPGHDRRVRGLRLMLQGRRQLERARPRWERAQAQLRQALGESDWERLVSALDLATEAAQEAGSALF